MTRRIALYLFLLTCTGSLPACSRMFQLPRNENWIVEEAPPADWADPMASGPAPTASQAGTAPANPSGMPGDNKGQAIRTVPGKSPQSSNQPRGQSLEVIAVGSQDSSNPQDPRHPLAVQATRTSQPGTGAAPRNFAPGGKNNKFKQANFQVEPNTPRGDNSPDNPGLGGSEDPDEPLVRAMESVFANEHGRALKYLKRYDPATQEFFLRLLPSMATIARKKVNQLSSAEAVVLEQNLQKLLDMLRPRCELRIAQACFCSQVKSFGNYEPMPETHVYLAGNDQKVGERVQLYVELQNFDCIAEKGIFETRLASSVAITGPKGEEYWQHNFDDEKQPIRSRSRLTDYYNNYSFFIPRLAAGNYTLTIRIADETHADRRRVAERSIPLRVSTFLNSPLP